MTLWKSQPLNAGETIELEKKITILQSLMKNRAQTNDS